MVFVDMVLTGTGSCLKMELMRRIDVNCQIFSGVEHVRRAGYVLHCFANL